MTVALDPSTPTALATLVPAPRRAHRSTRRRLPQAPVAQLLPAPDSLWTPPGLSMCIDDGPLVRAAGYRMSWDKDRYRIAVWEGETNQSILHRYMETAEGELVFALWRAFGRARSWTDFALDGSGPWGPGTGRVGDGGLIQQMEVRGDLLPWDD